MKRFWRKPSRIVLIILAIILIFLGLRFFGPLKPEKPAPPEVSVVQPEINTVSASGKVEAKDVANLTFQTSGQLAWVGIKEGETVKKWQTIASLDKRELEKDLKKKLLAYMNERWDFEQSQDDYNVEGRQLEKVILSDAEKRILEKAQFDLDSAVLDVEIKDLTNKLATLVSPIEGILAHIDTPIAGVNITPATANFTIIDPASVYFKTSVDEADISKVQVGQEAKVTLDSYPDEVFGGKVQRIDFVASPTAGGGTAFGVVISLPENTNFKFKVGMNGDAEISVK